MSNTENGTRPIWKTGLYITLFAFVGVVGGAYVGHLIVGSKPAEAHSNPKSEAQPYFLNLKVGDLFPLEDYTTPSGEKGNFERLFANRESIVFFVSLDCDLCHSLLRFWNTTLRTRLKPNVQVVVCLPATNHGIPPEFKGLVTGDSIAFIDVNLWKTRYNLIFSPIIVGTDDSGFITHIQHGFSDEVDFELAQRYLAAEKFQH